MVSFNGNTGVYLQYAHTRIRSILRKAGDPDAAIDPTIALHPAERALALELDAYSTALTEVSDTLEPHKLCGYLHDLARDHTAFYEASHVLNAEEPTRTNRPADGSVPRVCRYRRAHPNRSSMARVTVKHATASVFLLTRADNPWRIGLVRHPRLGKWMLPGGHVEPDENAAEAALREVAEETGLTARLLSGPRLDEPDGVDDPPVIAPLWIVEQHVPAERREPEPHTHVDHLYLALTETTAPAPGAELPFAWYTTDQLAAVDMFEDTRARATYLLGRIDSLTETLVHDRVLG